MKAEVGTNKLEGQRRDSNVTVEFVWLVESYASCPK
jgi:hypothetical protein